jgi:hypothetical protein
LTPLIGFSQNTVITTNGDTIKGYIHSLPKKGLILMKK